MACIGTTGICRSAVVVGLGLSCASTGISQGHSKSGIDTIAATRGFRRFFKFGCQASRNVYVIEYAAKLLSTKLTTKFFNENFVKKNPDFLTVGTQ